MLLPPFFAAARTARGIAATSFSFSAAASSAIAATSFGFSTTTAAAAGSTGAPGSHGNADARVAGGLTSKNVHLVGTEIQAATTAAATRSIPSTATRSIPSTAALATTAAGSITSALAATFTTTTAGDGREEQAQRHEERDDEQCCTIVFHYLFPWKFALEISVGARGTTATLLSAAPGCGIVIASRLSDPAALSTKTTRTIS